MDTHHNFSVEVEPEFIRTPNGYIHTMEYRPIGKNPNRSVIIVPAFGEEMNRSRRMVHEISILAARQGVTSFVPDLYGTGDSSGEFEDISLDIWWADISSVVEQARATGAHAIGCISIRLGSLIALAYDNKAHVFEKLVMWQPAQSGTEYLGELSRQRKLSESMRIPSRENGAPVREDTSRSSAGLMEQSGYCITAALAEQISHLNITTLLNDSSSSRYWFDIGDKPTRSRDREVVIESKVEDLSCVFQRVEGARFWNDPESKINQTLIHETQRIFGR